VNWAVLRKEWGAVTFVLTVLAGMVVVPLALYFANVSPAAITTSPVTTTSSARASGVTSPSASPSASATTSPSPSPSK
jgi:hypothetical protein